MSKKKSFLVISFIMVLNNKYIIALSFLVLTILGFNQEKRLSIGLNIGGYLPSKSYAQFLDGSHPTGIPRLMNDPMIRPELEEIFGYEILDWSYPANMRYDVNIYMGGYLGLRLDEDFSFIMNLDLMKTTVNQVLLFSLNNPQNIQGTFEQTKIRAEEQRFDISIGIENEFNEIGPLEFYAAGGGMVNYSKLTKHELIVRDTRRYNIMRYQYVGLQNRPYDGFGYGAFGQLGTRYYMNEKFSFDIGLNINVYRNKAYVEDLILDTGYPSAWAEDAAKFKLNGSVYFRMIWN